MSIDPNIYPGGITQDCLIITYANGEQRVVTVDDINLDPQLRADLFAQQYLAGSPYLPTAGGYIQSGNETQTQFAGHSAIAGEAVEPARHARSQSEGYGRRDLQPVLPTRKKIGRLAAVVAGCLAGSYAWAIPFAPIPGGIPMSVSGIANANPVHRFITDQVDRLGDMLPDKKAPEQHNKTNQPSTDTILGDSEL